MRNYNEEYSDNLERKYQYKIDLFVREKFLDKISHFIEEERDADTLEVGSYDGSMTELLLKRFTKIEVIEPSKDLANVVSSKFPNRVFVWNSKLEDHRPTKKYRNIFLVHTLEHVEDPLDFLGKIKNLLAEEGHLYLMVPNAGALSRRIATKMGLLEAPNAVMDGERKQGHLRTYDLDSLVKDVVASRLKIRETGGIFVKPMANFQLDAAIEFQVISQSYLNACYELSNEFPELCSSIYIVAKL